MTLGQAQKGFYRFWPFRRQTAFFASAVLVPVALIAIALLQRAGALDGNHLSGWVLLGATVVGLLPVILVILSGVGSVEAGGVKVAFAAVQEVVLTSKAAEPEARLADNLGQPAGVPVMDTTGDTIIASLSNALVDDIVVIDLKEGRAWWETRLLLLVAGATRLGYPKAIAFTAAAPNLPRKFIGWATTSELLRRHLDSSAPLRIAFEQAQRDCLLWQLSDASGGGPKTLPWSAAGRAATYVPSGDPVPVMSERTTDNRVVFPWPSPEAPYPPYVHQQDSFLPERLLLSRLQSAESVEPQVLTQKRLEEIFSPVLHTQSVDRSESEERWLETIVGTTGDYFAVTTNGQFNNLVPRRMAVNAVLLSVVNGGPRDTRRGA